MSWSFRIVPFQYPQGFFFFCNFRNLALGFFRLGKLVWQTPKLGNLLWCTICHFWSIKNKLAITHTIVIKLKENVTM